MYVYYYISLVKLAGSPLIFKKVLIALIFTTLILNKINIRSS